MPRIHCPAPLVPGERIELPAGAARHVQVLRMQPGDGLTLFDGRGGEYGAAVARMGRSSVEVTVGAHDPVEREAARPVHLLAGMPANERMDWLVEKAAELGAAGIAPLLTARTVLRLAGERADKKQAHWQAVAVAACEQCGRNRVPAVEPVRAWAEGWSHLPAGTLRLLLTLRPDSRPLAEAAAGHAGPVAVLGGPEGGLSPQEEDLALAAGFLPVTLGARVLRAETAQIAALARLADGA
ncbi:MAG: 16S rRNA (uracil(1498)-N(3))-methyltransferase [Xylophilus ampelinus]